jgi:hypothetical protein
MPDQIAGGLSRRFLLGAVFSTTVPKPIFRPGHCGLHNIRIMVFIKTALILITWGGAWLLHHPDNLSSGINPFSDNAFMVPVARHYYINHGSAIIEALISALIP